MRELILGGQRSGKSRLAERRAVDWLAQSPRHRATLAATALAHDDEMRARITRHRAARPAGIETVEAPLALAQAIATHSAPGHLLVVDCLTLWLTNWLMPVDGPINGAVAEDAWRAERAALFDALAAAPGPIVLVSNEVGWGVTPLGQEARRYADELGWLHQDVAKLCERVTLVVAGLPVSIKPAH